MPRRDARGDPVRGVGVRQPRRRPGRARHAAAALPALASPPVSLEIRLAEPGDFPQVADLCVAAYAPLMHGDPHYVDTLRDAARRAAEAVLLIAVDGTEV